MINIRYHLVSPKQITPDFFEESLQKTDVIVKPTYLSICKADQRYFQGTRDKKVLDKKLPLSLIHEGIGQVVNSNVDEFKKGDYVVMLPNIKTNDNETIKENYDATSKFCGSSTDGFMQNYVFCNKNNVIKIDENIPCLAFLELLSVAFNALEEFEKVTKINDEITIAVYGDGTVSYIMSLILKKIYDKAKIVVIGKHKDKLDCFSFVDETYLVNRVPDNFTYDHAFECVGGAGSEQAIDAIIKQIKPQGSIGLLGVSEYGVVIDTRKVLEKGLVLFGNSRSGYSDFLKSVNFVRDYPDAINYLNIMISNQVCVDNVVKIYDAFEKDLSNDFKTVMEWKI